MHKILASLPWESSLQGNNYTDRGHAKFLTTFGTNRGNQVIYCCVFKGVIKIQTVVLIWNYLLDLGYFSPVASTPLNATAREHNRGGYQCSEVTDITSGGSYSDPSHHITSLKDTGTINAYIEASSLHSTSCLIFQSLTEEQKHFSYLQITESIPSWWWLRTWLGCPPSHSGYHMWGLPASASHFNYF